jgi:hypothetical protein
MNHDATIHTCFAILLLFGLSVSAHALVLPKTNIGVSQFQEFCPSQPNSCWQPAPCEGQSVSVVGKIDYNNVFAHAVYPQLPYEKFFLVDSENMKNRIEVMVLTADNKTVFDKILDPQNRGENVIVRGIISGTDMPVMNSCKRGIRLELSRVEDFSVLVQ